MPDYVIRWPISKNYRSAVVCPDLIPELEVDEEESDLLLTEEDKSMGNQLELGEAIARVLKI